MSRRDQPGSQTTARTGHKGRNAPRLDAANLAGVTTLMNPLHLQPGVNLEDAEKAVMGKNNSGKKTEGDPVRLYTAELNQLAEELGIDLLDDEPPKRGGAAASNRLSPRAAASSRLSPRARKDKDQPQFPRGNSGGYKPDAGAYRPDSSAYRPDAGGYRPDAGGRKDNVGGYNRPASPRPAASNRGAPKSTYGGWQAPASSARTTSRVTDLIDNIDLGGDGSGDSDDSSEYYSDDSDDSDEYYSDSDGSGGDSGDSGGSGSSGYYSDSGTGTASSRSRRGHRGEDEEVDRIISRLESDLGIQTGGKREKHRHRVHGKTEVPHVERRGGADRATVEQERHRHINSVIEDIRGETRTTFGVERERAQDIKANKLEQIGQLRMALEEEGIDCGGVSNPSGASPMEEIDSVLNILRLKNDRNRYSSLAEEVILGAAEGIETVFDGSRTIPIVNWRPDYTGYHSTVACKLHRMRFETSQVVGSIIERYNIGPTARIIMELLPSFFLYPRQQKKQRGQPGLANDPHVADARLAINTIRASDDRRQLDGI
jgi:hypothetical protein